MGMRQCGPILFSFLTHDPIVRHHCGQLLGRIRPENGKVVIGGGGGEGGVDVHSSVADPSPLPS